MATPPGPTQVGASGPAITVYPADLFTSTNTPDPKVTSGGTKETATPGAVQTTANGGFYTQIQMVPADTVLTGVPGSTTPAPGTGTGIFTAAGLNTGYANPQAGSSVYLPLPWKINDIEMHGWADLSFFDHIPVINEMVKILNTAGRAAGGTGGALNNINPFLYMLYKQPAFREFDLAWSFSPNNAAEAQTLHEIINYLKTGALPKFSSVFSMEYPWLALVRLNPSRYMFDFKPCAVTSVNIDFTGSGHGPAFFTDGVPTIVNFTLGLKEVAIQVRSDTAWRSPNLTRNM